ncbi:MAG: hypothetical protein MUC29_02740 [Pyrinomonadaceae bacterium]|nr:hypothetical protein [Pyrinomonadaceae bacterium]
MSPNLFTSVDCGLSNNIKELSKDQQLVNKTSTAEVSYCVWQSNQLLTSGGAVNVAKTVVVDNVMPKTTAYVGENDVCKSRRSSKRRSSMLVPTEVKNSKVKVLKGPSTGKKSNSKRVCENNNSACSNMESHYNKSSEIDLQYESSSAQIEVIGDKVESLSPACEPATIDSPVGL